MAILFEPKPTGPPLPGLRDSLDRAFTIFQLMTIPEVSRHILIIIEHNHPLFEDAAEMIEMAFHASSDTAKEAAMLLCSVGIHTFLEGLAINADWVFYFDEGLRASTKLILKSILEGAKDPDQTA